MSSICAILSHQPGDSRTLTCLEHLISQSRQPDGIILINHDAEDSPTISQALRLADRHGITDQFHLLPTQEQINTPETDSSRGLNYAFQMLGADYAWILTPDLIPQPDSLKALLAQEVEEHTIRISLITRAADASPLGRPLAIPATSAQPGTSGPPANPAWKPVLRQDELPSGKLIPCRGNLTAALYPRSLWAQVGTPSLEHFLNGEDEQYPWRARQAGYRFITVADSRLELSGNDSGLCHANIAGCTYFYETGIPLPLMYLKLRNWALLERMKSPRAYLPRLARCGGYILFTIHSIIQSGEVSIHRVYNVFRALHNGFYGKLRPY